MSAEACLLAYYSSSRRVTVLMLPVLAAAAAAAAANQQQSRVGWLLVGSGTAVRECCQKQGVSYSSGRSQQQQQ
jgi:hypothetical protein